MTEIAVDPSRGESETVARRRRGFGRQPSIGRVGAERSVNAGWWQLVCMGKKRRGARELARVEKRVGTPIPAHLRPRPALDYEYDAKPDHPFRSVLRNLTPA
jgi:hypothetical protein